MSLAALGMAGNIIGSAGNVIGAFGQKKLAKQQLKDGKVFAQKQKGDYNRTYSDLMSLAQGQDTYQGDVSQYLRAEEEAKRQQKLATVVNPADQLFRDQASKTSANTFARGRQGARSGSDLMSLAGMVGANENQQMQNINIDTANRRQSMQQQANQSVVSTMAQTAATMARERGLQFESILGKQQNIMGLTKEQGLGALDMDYRQQQEQFARQGAVQDARSAIYSGFGDIFKSIGGGLTQMNTQNQQMEVMKNYFGQGQQQTPQVTPWQDSSIKNSDFDAKMRKDLMGLSWKPSAMTTSPNMIKLKPKGLDGNNNYTY